MQLEAGFVDRLLTDAGWNVEELMKNTKRGSKRKHDSDGSTHDPYWEGRMWLAEVQYGAALWPKKQLAPYFEATVKAGLESFAMFVDLVVNEANSYGSSSVYPFCNSTCSGLTNKAQGEPRNSEFKQTLNELIAAYGDGQDSSSKATLFSLTAKLATSNAFAELVMTRRVKYPQEDVNVTRKRQPAKPKQVVEHRSSLTSPLLSTLAKHASNGTHKVSKPGDYVGAFGNIQHEHVEAWVSKRDGLGEPPLFDAGAHKFAYKRCPNASAGTVGELVNAIACTNSTNHRVSAETSLTNMEMMYVESRQTTMPLLARKEHVEKLEFICTNSEKKGPEAVKAVARQLVEEMALPALNSDENDACMKVVTHAVTVVLSNPMMVFSHHGENMQTQLTTLEAMGKNCKQTLRGTGIHKSRHGDKCFCSNPCELHPVGGKMQILTRQGMHLPTVCQKIPVGTPSEPPGKHALNMERDVNSCANSLGDCSIGKTRCACTQNLSGCLTQSSCERRMELFEVPTLLLFVDDGQFKVEEYLLSTAEQSNKTDRLMETLAGARRVRVCTDIHQGSNNRRSRRISSRLVWTRKRSLLGYSECHTPPIGVGAATDHYPAVYDSCPHFDPRGVKVDEKATTLEKHYAQRVRELPPENWQAKFMRSQNVNFAAYGMCLATTLFGLDKLAERDGFKDFETMVGVKGAAGRTAGYNSCRLALVKHNKTRWNSRSRDVDFATLPLGSMVRFQKEAHGLRQTEKQLEQLAGSQRLFEFQRRWWQCYSLAVSLADYDTAERQYGMLSSVMLDQSMELLEVEGSDDGNVSSYYTRPRGRLFNEQQDGRRIKCARSTRYCHKTTGRGCASSHLVVESDKGDGKECLVSLRICSSRLTARRKGMANREGPMSRPLSGPTDTGHFHVPVLTLEAVRQLQQTRPPVGHRARQAAELLISLLEDGKWGARGEATSSETLRVGGDVATRYVGLSTRTDFESTVMPEIYEIVGILEAHARIRNASSPSDESQKDSWSERLAANAMSAARALREATDVLRNGLKEPMSHDKVVTAKDGLKTYLNNVDYLSTHYFPEWKEVDELDTSELGDFNVRTVYLDGGRAERMSDSLLNSSVSDTQHGSPVPEKGLKMLTREYSSGWDKSAVDTVNSLFFGGICKYTENEKEFRKVGESFATWRNEQHEAYAMHLGKCDTGRQNGTSNSGDATTCNEDFASYLADAAQVYAHIRRESAQSVAEMAASTMLKQLRTVSDGDTGWIDDVERRVDDGEDPWNLSSWHTDASGKMSLYDWSGNYAKWAGKQACKLARHVWNDVLQCDVSPSQADESTGGAAEERARNDEATKRTAVRDVVERTLRFMLGLADGQDSPHDDESASVRFTHDGVVHTAGFHPRKVCRALFHAKSGAVGSNDACNAMAHRVATSPFELGLLRPGQEHAAVGDQTYTVDEKGDMRDEDPNHTLDDTTTAYARAKAQAVAASEIATNVSVLYWHMCTTEKDGKLVFEDPMMNNKHWKEGNMSEEKMWDMELWRAFQDCVAEYTKCLANQQATTLRPIVHTSDGDRMTAFMNWHANSMTSMVGVPWLPTHFTQSDVWQSPSPDTGGGNDCCDGEVEGTEGDGECDDEEGMGGCGGCGGCDSEEDMCDD